MNMIKLTILVFLLIGTINAKENITLLNDGKFIKITYKNNNESYIQTKDIVALNKNFDRMTKSNYKYYIYLKGKVDSLTFIEDEKNFNILKKAFKEAGK